VCVYECVCVSTLFVSVCMCVDVCVCVCICVVCHREGVRKENWERACMKRNVRKCL